MRFGTRNVRSLYRTGALGLITSEIDKYRMDLVGVHEVRWEGSGRLSVFQNRILRRIFGPRRRGMRMGSGEGFTTRNFIVCIVHVI